MKSLFDNINLKNLNLKNRFVRSATWEKLADDNGFMTDKLLNIYDRVSKGGVGLIITSYAYISETEKPNKGMLGIYSDTFISHYKKLTDLVHKNGSKIILQIVYGGSQTKYNTSDRLIWGMSSVPHKKTGVIPKEMNQSEINLLKKYFADASVRAKKAGFDGVQIHGAHGYLLSQSLSTYYNQRKDLYGGSLENRSRLITEVYSEIRKNVGDDYHVSIKINCSDFEEYGTDFEQSVYLLQKLDKLGIDSVEVSGGKKLSQLKEHMESVYAWYAGEIAKKIKAPVILVGLNRSYATMDKILNTTDIDLFSMARPFLAEPELIKRWENGDLSNSKCISCGKCYGENENGCIMLK